MLIPDDNEARIGEALQKIGQKSAGGLPGGVRIHDIDLRLGRLEIAQIGSESRFQLLGNDFELRLAQNALELAQHQGVRREQADG